MKNQSRCVRCGILTANLVNDRPVCNQCCRQNLVPLFREITNAHAPGQFASLMESIFLEAVQRGTKLSKARTSLEEENAALKKDLEQLVAMTDASKDANVGDGPLSYYGDEIDEVERRELEED